MIEDISKLYQKIIEEQKESNKKAELIDEKESYQNETISDLLESEEEPFDNFLSKLGEKLQEELLEKEPTSEDVDEDVAEEIEIHNNNYVSELRKTDKPFNKKVLKENEEITNIISEQIQDEIGKVKTQISRMAIEGGGGSVAVQYAKGGTMNGDLNVTGKYLSGGIDLSTLIGSGGEGLSGTTDRLVSGTEVFKLNTDGTFNFPNNIITPQDEVILTLESTKVLDNYYNRLALSPHGFFASDHNGNSITIDSTDNEILIDSNDTYFWKFNNQGALEGPFGTLNVSGNLSASNVVYASGGNSDLWNSTYTTVSSNSANWQNLYTTVQNNSSTWVNTISAQTLLAKVYNADSVTMNKGDVVYTFGATGDVMSVKLASNVGDTTSARTLGFVNETIATGGIGYVVIAGQIDKMPLPHPFQDGDELWLGEVAGTFTRVKPTAPNHGVYLGVIERANNGNGLAYVKVQNGYELDELHDVSITNVSAGDVLQRNAANTLWVNAPLSADKWNSVYSSVQANSATWNAGSVGPYQATYYKSANQNLTNGSTDITFDQYATWNNDNGYITHTSGSADLIVVQAGVYQLEFNASIVANGATWNAGTNKIISIDITRSPSAEQVVIAQTANTAANSNYNQSMCSTVRLETGDIINLRIQNNFATATPFAQGVQNTYDLNTWFYWRFISQ